MSGDGLPPLPPELAEMLAIEARRPPRPAAHRDAVLRRIRRTLALGGAARPDSSGVSEQGGSPAAASPTFRSLARTTALAGSVFVLGGLAGAGVHGALAPARPALAAVATLPVIVILPATEVRRPEAPVLMAQSPSADIAAPRVAPGMPVAPISSSERAAPADSLAEERALLEAARAGMKAGDRAAVFARLDRHARRFPQGKLSEECEALRVQALVRFGNAEEARARAAAFRSKFPSSVFQAAIDAAVRIPNDGIIGMPAIGK